MQTTKSLHASDFIVRGAVKVIEIVGVSERSFDDAIRSGLGQAAETIEGITGIEILHQTLRIDNNRITQYHVDMKIAFGISSDMSRKD
jgi:flavin-binding protein dodecin